MNAEHAPDGRPLAADRRAGGLRSLLIGIAGLAYAFIIWTAVFYTVQLAVDGLTGYGWLILLLPSVVAAVVFAVAVVTGRRRTLGAFVMVLLAGLGLSAVFLLDTFGYVIRNLQALTVV